MLLFFLLHDLPILHEFPADSFFDVSIVDDVFLFAHGHDGGVLNYIYDGTACQFIFLGDLFYVHVGSQFALV